MRDQQLQAAHKELWELLQQQKSITIGVRDGAFLEGEAEIFLDDDLRSGPTRLLAGNAIFELTLQAGLDARELETLIAILSEDPGHTCRPGEDLVTLLWRHHLDDLHILDPDEDPPLEMLPEDASTPIPDDAFLEGEPA